MIRLSSTVPAPADLGLDVIGVPEGSDVELALRLESVVEGVLVSGTARVQLLGECVRCLDPVSATRAVDIQELFFYPDQAPSDDEDALRLEGELLDLEPVVRDAVVLGLPFQPLCRDDCPGLCVRVRRAPGGRARSTTTSRSTPGGPPCSGSTRSAWPAPMGTTNQAATDVEEES